MAERKKFLLRVDPDVFDAVQRWADDELRSVNAQVEFALRQALRAAGRPIRRAAAARESTAASQPTRRRP